MHFRIQCNKDSRAIDILRRGLEDVQKICDTVTETFNEAMTNKNSE